MSAESVPLAELRAAVLTNAEAGAATVQNWLTGRGGVHQAAAETDLLILLAEAQQQAGALGEATDTVARAAAVAQTLPGDDPRRFVVMAVYADVTICRHHPDAVGACDMYLNLAVRRRHRDHEQVAGALRAIAVYHHTSAATGRALLTARLARLPKSDAWRPMLAAAVAATADGPAAVGGADGPLPPLPGAVLQPEFSGADPNVFAHRAGLYPAEGSAAGPPPLEESR